MRKSILILSLLMCFNAGAQEGINFRHCSFEEACSVAKSENKLIFADVYTQWCGPCYNMAKQVFTLYSVGTYYNEHFISLKIDAENGEGIDLAKKYEVHSYPTYLFINPETQEVVHISSSRQEAAAFIRTGECALDPHRTSLYLEQQRSAGNTDPKFLIDYAYYCSSVYRNNDVLAVIAQLSQINGYGLENRAVWDLFVTEVKGSDNVFYKDLVLNIDKYRSMYGVEAADSKIYSETRYIRDIDALTALPDFNGKDVISLQVKLNNALNSEKYEEAAKIADELMDYSGPYYKDVCGSLYFTGRSNLYGGCPDFWSDKCLEISRYVAYNHPDRDDVSYHQTYAVQLEKKLERSGNSLSEPAFGTKEYSLRPSDLKPKPIKKK